VTEFAAAIQDFRRQYVIAELLWIRPMAKRQAFFDEIMEFGSKLPWRIAVLLAIGTFVGLHVLALQTSSPEFTREAREFARQTKIELIDGKALGELIGAVSIAPRTTDATWQTAPACPKCGTPMVQRVARQGKHAGHLFWGCTQYPICTGILQI
jgi:Topoisomerase DNA binding C4 zinc finger